MRVPQKHKRVTTRIEPPGLLRMQRQPESRDELMEPDPLTIGATRNEQDEIIGIADESSAQVPALDTVPEGAVEQVQVHIREERRDDAALRCALPWASRPPIIAFVDDGRLEKLLHQREHGAVNDPFRHHLHQSVVRNRVEVGGHVRIDDPAHPRVQRRTNRIERVVRRSSRPKAERVRLEVRFEDRFQHQLCRRLDDPVAYVGNGDLKLHLPQCTFGFGV